MIRFRFIEQQTDSEFPVSQTMARAGDMKEEEDSQVGSR